MDTPEMWKSTVFWILAMPQLHTNVYQLTRTPLYKGEIVAPLSVHYIQVPLYVKKKWNDSLYI